MKAVLCKKTDAFPLFHQYQYMYRNGQLVVDVRGSEMFQQRSAVKWSQYLISMESHKVLRVWCSIERSNCQTWSLG